MDESIIPRGAHAPEPSFDDEKGEPGLATTIFYERHDIRELAARLQMMVVGGETRYTQAQAITLAQAAFAHGLSPFNGEIWLLVKNGKSLGLMVGIKGLRKHARRQTRRARTRYQIKIDKVTDPEELAVIAPPNIYSEKVLVYKALLTVEAKVGQWIVNLTKLKKAGFSNEDALSMAGARPVTVGVGIYDPELERYAWRFGRQSPAQIAEKRSEADALKKEFDVLLALEYKEEVDSIFGADVSVLDQDFDADGIPSFDIPPAKENPSIAAPRQEKEILADLGL